MDLDTIKLTQAQLENLKDHGFCNIEIEKGKIERLVMYGLFNNYSHDIIEGNVQSKRNDDENIN